jgi:hypothetical protein
MNTAPQVETYRFEGFVLDVRRGSVLTTAGEVLPLRRRSFEMLSLSQNSWRTMVVAG